MISLTTPLVLASRSPRRRALLNRLGLTFTVHPSEADEAWPASGQPGIDTETIARRKAVTVAPRFPDALTLAADTVVLLDGAVLGKPTDRDHARFMLRHLSGRTHEVITGIALLGHGRDETAHETTRVTFADLTEDEIARYVDTDSPLDKAGGYGIQDDAGALFVRRIEGDYFNVVGLPLHRLYRTLRNGFQEWVRL